MTSLPITRITIYEVANLEAGFAEAITNSQPLELKLNELEELDTAGVQWLLSLKQRKEKQGSALILSQVPEAIREVFELLGVNTLLTAAIQDNRHA